MRFPARLHIVSGILFLLLLVHLHGENFHYSPQDLTALSEHIAGQYGLQTYRVPVVEQDITGISLLELLPLMEYVNSVTIESAEGNVSFDNGQLEDLWSESYFIPSNVSLYFDGRLYPGIENFSFSGGRLSAAELEIWLSWEGTDVISREVQRFTDRHDIEIELVNVPSADSKLSALAMARGQMPDLTMVQSSSLPSLLESRAIQPLNYLKRSVFLPQGLQSFSLDGQLLAMPLYFDSQLAFFNLTEHEDLPPFDWNLNDMERMAANLQEDYDYPLVWNAYSSNWLIPFQMSWGKISLIDNGRIIINDQSGEDALNYVLSLRDSGYLVPMERDAMDALFISGDIGMIFTGSYAIPYFESLGLDFAVRPYPLNQQTGLPVSSLLDFKGVVLSRTSRHPLLARRVLQFLSGAGFQSRFCSELYKLSARQDSMQHIAANMNYGRALAVSAESGTVIPPDRIYGTYKNTMWRLLRFVFNNQMSVQQVLETGQQLLDAGP